ncbi:MAG: hypothetical protein JSR98_08595 [Proteobacteria bacterium]|nr:hypothetical protein [Pseudomonadota bacterium]
MIPTSDLWMLGRRPPPRLRVTEAAPVAGSPSCKYVVAMRFGSWQVLRDGLDAEVFPDRDEAIRLACARAREQASTGVAGIVIVQGDVQEMHCFTPPHAEVPKPDRTPQLRLVEAARNGATASEAGRPNRGSTPGD